MASVHGRPVGAGAPNEKDGVAFRDYAVLSFIGRLPLATYISSLLNLENFS